MEKGVVSFPRRGPRVFFLWILFPQTHFADGRTMKIIVIHSCCDYNPVIERGILTECVCHFWGEGWGICQRD